MGVGDSKLVTGGKLTGAYELKHLIVTLIGTPCNVVPPLESLPAVQAEAELVSSMYY